MTGRKARPRWTNRSGISGRCRHHRGFVRVCALSSAIALGVLAVPAMARAGDTSGTGELLQQSDPAAVMTDTEALVSQVVASTSADVSAASVATPTSGSAIAATVESETSTTVSEALASAETGPTYAQATAPPPEPAAPQALPVAGRSRGALRPHRHPAQSRSSRSPTPPAATMSSGQAIRTPLSAAHPHRTRSDRATAKQDRGARARSRHLPPLPLPPQNQGVGAQAGGLGMPLPPVAGALAAALLVIFCELLSRLLPRSAFRKPRRLALPPWHPG
jgi:hypothetical protein